MLFRGRQNCSDIDAKSAVGTKSVVAASSRRLLWILVLSLLYKHGGWKPPLRKCLRHILQTFCVDVCTVFRTLYTQ